MMTPAWGNQSRGNTPRRESYHTNGSNNQTKKPPTETTISETPSPVIKMPPKKFYDYPEPYFDRRPSLFQVILLLEILGINEPMYILTSTLNAT